jgi:hypothetical protein
VSSVSQGKSKIIDNDQKKKKEEDQWWPEVEGRNNEW